MTKCKECEETIIKNERSKDYCLTLISALIITAITSVLFNMNVGMICGLMTYCTLMLMMEIHYKV